jgi:hypothetical protein
MLKRLVLALFIVCSPAGAFAQEGATRVEGAIDGIFAAFDTHPIVALSDAHGLAQEGALYAAIVRDPRFSEKVGNLVVEFGGAAQQAVIDRYVAGEAVPYEQLRKVWTDVVGWVPTVQNTMYPNVFAAVRAANANLPADRGIKVWLGEPPIDWSLIHSAVDLQPKMEARDSHPAQLIEREILGKGRKALVIYGGLHFRSPFSFTRGIDGLVEAKFPGSFFFVSVYSGLATPACASAFEARLAQWPGPALAAPVKGTWLAAELTKPGCNASNLRPPGAAPLDPALSARIAEASSGANGDAILYLGPAASLTWSPNMPDMYLDDAFFQEISRRSQITPGPPPPPLSWTRALDANLQPVRPRTGALPTVAGAPPRPVGSVRPAAP